MQNTIRAINFGQFYHAFSNERVMNVREKLQISSFLFFLFFFAIKSRNKSKA